MHTALLVIDVQNDYFPNGNFPLWHAQETSAKIVPTISGAIADDIAIIHIQHIANPANGASPFFNARSSHALFQANAAERRMASAWWLERLLDFLSKKAPKSRRSLAELHTTLALNHQNPRHAFRMRDMLRTDIRVKNITHI